MLEYLKEQLKRLLEQRDTLNGEIDKILEQPKAEKRDLNPAEETAFTEKRGEVLGLGSKIEDTRTAVADAQEDATRAARAAQVNSQMGTTGEPHGRVTSEPMTYERGNGKSYFLDLARAQVQGDSDALSRLRSHGQEMDVVVPERERRRDEQARQALHGIGDLEARQRNSVYEKRVNPNRTDGTGGFVTVAAVAA